MGLIPPSSCLPVSADLLLHPLLCVTPDCPLAPRLHSGTREIGRRCRHAWGHNLWVSWRSRSTFLCGMVSTQCGPCPLGNLWLLRKAKTCHLLLCLLFSNYNLVQKVSRSSGIRLPPSHVTHVLIFRAHFLFLFQSLYLTQNAYNPERICHTNHS